MKTLILDKKKRRSNLVKLLRLKLKGRKTDYLKYFKIT